MGRGSTIDKLERLDQLIGKLKTGEAYTASTLAEELCVSLRTMMRDLKTLRDKGYPIDADKGRGGGVRLYPRWGVGRLTMNYREVIDLLLALSVLEKLNSQLFLNNLESIKNKLYASFPDTQRPKIRKIRNRILIGELAPTTVTENYSSTVNNQQNDCILESFFDQKCLDICYKQKDGTITKRLIEIHYLYLNWPIWYLICFDHLRNEPRTFRIDRIQVADITGDKFQSRTISFFSPELEKFSSRL
ncbi:MAG: WYL domain-containing protein [Colwellia sp.]|nr:WYL domain-containing protein [Colwellia sp.]